LLKRVGNLSLVHAVGGHFLDRAVVLEVSELTEVPLLSFQLFLLAVCGVVLLLVVAVLSRQQTIGLLSRQMLVLLALGAVRARRGLD